MLQLKSVWHAAKSSDIYQTGVRFGLTAWMAFASADGTTMAVVPESIIADVAVMAALLLPTLIPNRSTSQYLKWAWKLLTMLSDLPLRCWQSNLTPPCHLSAPLSWLWIPSDVDLPGYGWTHHLTFAFKPLVLSLAFWLFLYKLQTCLHFHSSPLNSNAMYRILRATYIILLTGTYVISPVYLLLSVEPKLSCPAGSCPGVGLSHREKRFLSRRVSLTMLINGVGVLVCDSVVNPKPCRIISAIFAFETWGSLL